MSERRLVLRYREPDAVDGKRVEYSLGEKPPYLVVLRDADPATSRQAAQALSEAHGKRLAGSPILMLPAGTEFELWEVDSASETPAPEASMNAPQHRR